MIIKVGWVGQLKHFNRIQNLWLVKCNGLEINVVKMGCVINRGKRDVK